MFESEKRIGTEKKKNIYIYINIYNLNLRGKKKNYKVVAFRPKLDWDR